MSVGHCRDCGHDNPETERFCQACNADLAYQDILTSNGTDRQTVRYRALKDAAEKVTAGQMSQEEFASFLQTSHASLQEKSAALVQDVYDAQYDQESPEEISMGMEGIRNIEAGMHEMYLYLNDHSPAHLEQGLALAWEGNEQIIAAMRINRETRQGILEEFSRLYEEL